MSNIVSTKKHVRPTCSDEQFIDQMEYEDDFGKASIWFHKRMIRHIRAIDSNTKPISEMFNQLDGDFCKRFSYYCEVAKRYDRNAVPREYLDDDYRIACILIKRLEARAVDLANIHQAQRLVNQFYDLLAANAPVNTDEEFHQQIDFYHRQIASIFAQISEDFYRQEHATKMPAPMPATKEDVEQILHDEVAYFKIKQDIALTSLTETGKLVKRMDNREMRAQRKKKVRYTDDQLNSIHTLWLKAQNDPSVKSGSAHKASLEAAVKYYKKEFNALGVYTADDLRKALKAWSWHASKHS